MANPNLINVTSVVGGNAGFNQQTRSNINYC